MKTLLENRKIILLIFVVMLLIYGAQGISYGQEAHDTNVEFSDRTLAIMVRLSIAHDSVGDFLKSPNIFELIKMPEAEVLKIPKTELKKLTILFADEQTTSKLRLPSITDLTGLEHATQLLDISLSGQPIIDLTPLSQLVQLRELNLRWSETVADITPLMQLTQLRRLILFKNQIIDIAPLAQLTQLTTLNLGSNRISDITPITQLTQLTNLHLESNEINDITPITQLTQLKELDLWNNEISDITPITQLTQLKELFLGGNYITNLVPLAQLSHLNVLLLEVNQIRDISPIAHLKQLTWLNLAYNQIKDVTPLAELTESLIELDLSRNQVRDVTPLAQLTYLEKLDLEDNQIVDVTPLAQLTYLEELNLEKNRIRNVAPLAELIYLEKLYLRDNPITDTYPLSTLLDENPNIYIDIEVSREEGGPTVTVSTPQPLTAATLNGSVVTLMLSSGEFELRGKIKDAVTISGISGITFDWTDIERVSDTEARIKLTFGGTIETNVTLTFTVGPGAIKNYNGPAQTAEILVSVDTEISSTDTALKEDVNGDGIVNILDLVLVASNFGKTGQSAADVNGDKIVNIQDLVLVAGALGSSATAPSLYAKALSTPIAADVKQWLSQAEQLNITDATSQRGILFLQQLLTALTPKETALLPNFPNPFNPETWIPYQLSKPADVTLHIYAVNGTLVRTLALGDQAAGIYQSRNRAAHWDGKNEIGEKVATGIYFYTLKAGDFTATRKMLIRK